MRKHTWIIAEYWTIIRAHFVNTFIPYDPKHWTKGEKGDIVIVQGFNDKPTYLRKIADKLNSLGYRIHTIPELKRQHAPVKYQAQLVADYLQRHNLSSYFFLAHSKGTIVTKYALDNCSIPLPRKVFALAPPFGGSVFGHLPLLNLHELKKGSEILKTLQANKKNNHLFVTVYPEVDNMILIPKSSHLEGAENIQLSIKGHTIIMESDEMVQTIVDKIIALDP